MPISPYLFYDSNCEAAFKFYEKALGGKIEMMLTHREGAARDGVAAGTQKRRSCDRAR